MVEFNWAKWEMVNRVLVSMNCIVSKTIIDGAKHSMLKRDNLQKHMGNQQVEHVVFDKGLKEIKFIMKIIISIFQISCCLLFDDLNLCYDKWVMVWLWICSILTHFVEWVAHGWIRGFEAYVRPPKGGKYAQEALERCLWVGKWQIFSPSSFGSLKRDNDRN